MYSFRDKAKEFIRSEEGPTATEYATFLAIFVVALISAVGPLQTAWERLYAKIGDTVTK